MGWGWKTALSQAGLCAAVGAYALLGAALFHYIEHPAERRTQGHISRDTDHVVDSLYAFISRQSVLREAVVKAEAERLLKAYELNIIDAAKREGYDGDDENVDYQWTFPGALLYSITVFTTIGYGHICPKTGLGRGMTLIYGTIGIPLMLICLANIADSLAHVFSYVYFKQLTSTVNWEWAESGSKIPLLVTESCPVVRQPRLRRTPTSKSEDGLASRSYAHMPAFDLRRLRPRKQLPVSLGIVTVVAFLGLGAVVFALWEDWTVWDGAYYAFVTLSTIGFGDLVPGKSVGGSQAQLLFCSLYLLFGMALIAMAFKLMQDDVAAKAHWLGTKIGLLSVEEEEDSDDEDLETAQNDGMEISDEALSLREADQDSGSGIEI